MGQEWPAGGTPAQLREHGLRVTSQRLVIMEILANLQGTDPADGLSVGDAAASASHGHVHFTAQEVYSIARHRLPGLNTATVYRTLETLHQAGLVDASGPPGSTEVNFSLHNPASRHCHLVCRTCRHEAALDISVMADMAEAVARATGFRVDVEHLTLAGLCRTCAAAEDADEPGAELTPPTAVP